MRRQPCARPIGCALLGIAFPTMSAHCHRWWAASAPRRSEAQRSPVGRRDRFAARRNLQCRLARTAGLPSRLPILIFNRNHECVSFVTTGGTVDLFIRAFSHQIKSSRVAKLALRIIQSPALCPIQPCWRSWAILTHAVPRSIRTNFSLFAGIFKSGRQHECLFVLHHMRPLWK